MRRGARAVRWLMARRSALSAANRMNGRGCGLRPVASATPRGRGGGTGAGIGPGNRGYPPHHRLWRHIPDLPGPLHELRCVASDGAHRCAQLVLDVDEGSWVQVEAPHIPGRAGQLTLDAISAMHWVWVITGASGRAPTATPSRGIPGAHRAGVARLPAALRVPQGLPGDLRPPLRDPCKHEHTCFSDLTAEPCS
jgi:hypothetical protein